MRCWLKITFTEDFSYICANIEKHSFKKMTRVFTHISLDVTNQDIRQSQAFITAELTMEWSPELPSSVNSI